MFSLGFKIALVVGVIIFAGLFVGSCCYYFMMDELEYIKEKTKNKFSIMKNSSPHFDLVLPLLLVVLLLIVLVFGG